MEGTLANNALEIAIIGGLIAIIVAFITIGAVFVFRLFNRVDQLADKLGETNERIGETHSDLNEKIDQTRLDLNEKIDQTRLDLNEKIDQTRRELSGKMDQLREDMIRQMADMKADIITALVNHTHPEPGGPPVFTAPPPTVPSEPAIREPEAAPADD